DNDKKYIHLIYCARSKTKQKKKKGGPLNFKY
nr:ribosomal protein S15 [Papaver nudicaule]